MGRTPGPPGRMNVAPVWHLKDGGLSPSSTFLAWDQGQLSPPPPCVSFPVSTLLSHCGKGGARDEEPRASIWLP